MFVFCWCFLFFSIVSIWINGWCYICDRFYIGWPSILCRYFQRFCCSFFSSNKRIINRFERENRSSFYFRYLLINKAELCLKRSFLSVCVRVVCGSLHELFFDIFGIQCECQSMFMLLIVQHRKKTDENIHCDIVYRTWVYCVCVENEIDGQQQNEKFISIFVKQHRIFGYIISSFSFSIYILILSFFCCCCCCNFYLMRLL